jgi:hypothetical protein
MFDSEEALEVLLATLPEPNLPPEIKRRVLAALARSHSADRALDNLLERGAEIRVPSGLSRDVLARLEPMRAAGSEAARSDAGSGDTGNADVGNAAADALDALLDADRDVSVPADLARRTLARLEVERGIDAFGREARLDALLERDAHVTAPADLTARLLAGLAPARRAQTRRPMRVRSIWALAAAALIVAVLSIWTLWPGSEGASDGNKGRDFVQERGAGDGRTPSGEDRDVRRGDSGAESGDVVVARAPDPKMLAALDVLENWELLIQTDVDVLLATIEPADELLLEYQEGG